VTRDEPVLDFPAPSFIDIVRIDSITGGSAGAVFRKKPVEEASPLAGQPPPSRGIDFLFEDLNKL